MILHDESKKFIICYKNNNEDFGNDILFPGINSKSQPNIIGNYYKKYPDLDINYIPTLSGRCEIMYNVVKLFFDYDNGKSGRFNEHKRMITIYADQDLDTFYNNFLLYSAEIWN